MKHVYDETSFHHIYAEKYGQSMMHVIRWFEFRRTQMAVLGFTQSTYSEIASGFIIITGDG